MSSSFFTTQFLTSVALSSVSCMMSQFFGDFNQRRELIRWDS
jgi:hypothetical protein